MSLEARSDSGKKYLEGIITLPKEDAEGGLYTTQDMDLANLVEHGYLDVNHLMFERGISEAVIGQPVEVRVVRDGIWGKFEMAANSLAEDIWNYVHEHPGLLGFSIAGGLLKPVFERGGKWLFDKDHGGSVGLCRFPMNPGTYAIAATKSATTGVFTDQGILRLMHGLCVDMRAGKIKARSEISDWYRYFLSAGMDPLGAFTMSSWAGPYFKGLASSNDIIMEIKNTIFVPDDEEVSLSDGLAEDMASWLAVHPKDEHFSSDGRFRTLDDAVQHLRYCKRLAPQQVARIMGYARSDPKRFFSYAPQGWPSDI